MHSIQEKLLHLLKEKNLTNVTLREVGTFIGEKFPQKIKHHLSQLEKKGFITIDSKTKSISLKNQGPSDYSPFVSVPIVGAANCGPATIFANENIESYLKISSNLLRKKKNIFAIKAQGFSMNKAVVNGNTIEDGDYLLIDSDDTVARNGDIVVSVIDNMANIKRYMWDQNNNQIVLVSESSKDFPPIYVHEDDDFYISGKVIQVIKKPRFD